MEPCEQNPTFGLETGCSYGALRRGDSPLAYISPQDVKELCSLVPWWLLRTFLV